MRLVISGDQGELYLSDMETPVMFFHDLKLDEREGSIGLRGGSDVHFANFKVAHGENYPLKGQAPEMETDPEGVLNLTTWQVSDRFSENELDGVTKLSEMPAEISGWMELRADESKIANIMRLERTEKEGDTVFATVTLTSDSIVNKILSLGYSDRVKVFLNGQMLYSGTNGFRTRDYRYLGSVGFFDQIVLPLKQGDNELWLALSESFGGWGMKARIVEAGSLRLD